MTPTGTATATPAAHASVMLRPFETRMASVVAGWVKTPAELLWLAPATAFPLTADKVAGWTAARGRGYVLCPVNVDYPLAYGELNPLASAPDDLWLGHLIVDPRRRGKGLGRKLLSALIDEGLQRLGAKRLVLVVFPDNTAAVNCYIRAGFKLKGEETHRGASDRLRHRLLRFELGSR